MSSLQRRGKLPAAPEQSDSRPPQAVPLELQVANLRNMVQAIANNQQQVSKSLDDSDAQFCCLLRVIYTKMNQLIDCVNEGAPPEAVVAKIDLTYLNRTFAEFDAVRRIPDFQQHLNEWFMGLPLKDILDLAQERDKKRQEMMELARKQALEAKRQQEAAASPEAPPAASEGHPEGATFFGEEVKDVQGQVRNSEQAPEAAQADAGTPVPEVQDTNAGVDQPANG